LLLLVTKVGCWIPAFAGMTVMGVGAAATPSRIVSLNLCTDEYLLLTARTGQIASISRLGADVQESPLAARAHGLKTNPGRLSEVIGQQPDLVLTMGHDPQASALAGRLGIRLVALPYPTSPAQVVAQMRQVAGMVGNAPAGEAFARDVAMLGASAPPARPGLMIGGSGLAPAMDGLALPVGVGRLVAVEFVRAVARRLEGSDRACPRMGAPWSAGSSASRFNSFNAE
jgi:iron complex transport system substrate-binding protein